MTMMTKFNARGSFLIDIIVGLIVLGLSASAMVVLVGAIGQHKREIDTKLQEDSYRLQQSELALTGADPTAMGVKPLGAATHTMITIVQANDASRDQAGSTPVVAFTATSDAQGRSGSLGYRIGQSASAVPTSPSTALLPPSFRLNGVIPESEFTPNLTGEILANPENPAGTVYRYTTDGSNPTNSSQIWSAASSIAPYPLPSVLKAAAFHTDPLYSPSPVVSANLSRVLTIAYARVNGGSSTGFTYAEVTGGTNAIKLSLGNAPTDAAIYYTYDGSAPATSQTGSTRLYSSAFHVPLASWSPSVLLRAIVVTGQSNITAAPLAVTITPLMVAMPTPMIGSQGGTSTAATVQVSDSQANAILRYQIDAAVTGTSPTVSSGSYITVSAP